eukprot:TRINITY_DN4573_c2_g2_i1.p1 TRINITY_DN4573_c2_g2~~TRINITY_DN4573_c2_g2_i1.p1  ORF type:complete len:386 (+),score=79.98 TRINITY_DN4573_c2_g2_i1:63-1220(+)
MTQALPSSLCTPPAHVLSNTTPPQQHPTGKVQDRSEIDAAVEQGDVEHLMLQLRSRANHSCEPVRQVVTLRHPGALELLLRSGYPADAPGGIQPLQMLVESGFTSKESDGYRMAELLLRYGSRTDDHVADGSPTGMSLLGLAVHQKCVLGAELLLFYGANPNRVSVHGKAPLHIVCEDACPWQPLNMLPLFPEVQSFGASAELLDVDIMGLPSLQDVFGDAPPALPTTLPFDSAALVLERPMLPTFSNSLMLGAWSPFQATTPGEGYGKLDGKSSSFQPRDTQDHLVRTAKIVELLLRSGANACAQDDSGQTPADKLPMLATELKSKLQRAEIRTRQHDFVSACWPLQKSACGPESVQRSSHVAKSAVIACLSSSDPVDAIASFL